MTQEQLNDIYRKHERERARDFPCPSMCQRDGEPVGMEYVCTLGDPEFSRSLYQCPVCKSVKEFWRG